MRVHLQTYYRRTKISFVVVYVILGSIEWPENMNFKSSLLHLHENFDKYIRAM